MMFRGMQNEKHSGAGQDRSFTGFSLSDLQK